MAEAESADTVRGPADRVRDLLGIGYIDAKRARAIELAVPEAREQVIGWLADFARAGAWRDFEAFANLALHLRPEAVGAAVAPVVGAAPPGANVEDLVELLGDAGPGAAPAVPALLTLLEARAPHDGPYYGLSLKIIAALAAIATPSARAALHAFAADAAPTPLRAAATLGAKP